MTLQTIRPISFLRRSSTYAAIMLTTAFCLGNTTDARSAKAPELSHAPVKSLAVKKHWYEIGKASWYGGSFQGRETASGEDYNMTDLTCAHRSLPLGTLVRVTNLLNHKSVVVRVNDRGPYLGNRIVDLSYAAAHFLGFKGVARVRLDVLRHPTEVADAESPLPIMGR